MAWAENLPSLRGDAASSASAPVTAHPVNPQPISLLQTGPPVWPQEFPATPHRGVQPTSHFIRQDPSEVEPAPEPTVVASEVEPTAPDLTGLHRLTGPCLAAGSDASPAEISRSLTLSESGLRQGSINNQAQAWSLWTGYLDARIEGDTPDPDPFMFERSRPGRSMAMVLWAHWLRDTGAASAAGVAAELAHLRGNWTTASLGHLLAHVTESETSRISKAIRPSDDEVRLIMAKQRRNLKLPLCFEVLDTLLESHFINLLPRRHTLPALDKIGGFLGAMFATETAQRGANWVGAQACKTKDVRFQLGVGAPDLGFTKEAVGDEARAGIMMSGKTDRLQDILKGVCRIVRVDIDIVNTKQKKSLTVSVERRSEEEAKITEMFGIWLIISGTKDEDPFMTRYGVSKTQWNRQAKSRARKVKPTPDHVAKVTRRLICSSACSAIIK